ncbi:uncharacterized protein LOC123697496 [Colias croceus]|uniref:uncharacterized protein LOC123697496 n=1 Tax=Colias crocea TaxID=72248 RepID=UPI001E27B6E7|nr:uncharacterized protein LOC123697496 [Colias croceus]
MKMLKLLAPKKFLCSYPLSLGATCGGIILICVTASCGLALFVQVMTIKDCDVCSRYVWRNAYSFSVTGIVYCAFMLAIHVWFLWGIHEEKSSVVLCWSVITAMWLAQTFVLLIILICMYSTQVNFIAWVLSFIFGIIAVCVLWYIVLVGYGYWLELREKDKHPNLNVSSN